MALVVLLRGVNVGGHRTFRPSVLAQRLRRYQVVSIGAAGTFVVRRPGLRGAVRSAFARLLPFDTEIIMCDGTDIKRLVARDPLAGQPVRRDRVRFVSLLSRSPRAKPVLPIHIPSTARWMVRVVARRKRLIVGEYRRRLTVLKHLAALDRLFGVTLTTRSWSTMALVAAMLRSGRFPL